MGGCNASPSTLLECVSIMSGYKSEMSDNVNVCWYVLWGWCVLMGCRVYAIFVTLVCGEL